MKRRTGTILICDDEAGFRGMVTQTLTAEGHQMLEARTLAEAREILAGVAPDLLLLDLVLPDGEGVDLLGDLPELAPGCVCLVLTAHASLRTAIAALRLGAFDYIEKPLRLDDVVARVGALMVHRAVMRENAVLRRLVAGDATDGGLEALSGAFAAVLDAARRVAERGRTLLITGESGVGKEEVARYIHASSSDRDGPFVPVNLAAVPESLAEATLFGHTRGAFTGAVQASDGLIRAAAGGTLFLDEIAEAAPSLQAKLLRFVDRGEVLAVGATHPVEVPCRVLAATNRDLEALVREGRFRDDLFHRINVIHIDVPPLRRHRDDIPALARRLAARLAADRGLLPPAIAPEAMAALIAYDWPGNVRELRNVLERALILGSGIDIGPGDLPDEMRVGDDSGDESSMDLRRAVAAFEREHIARVIAACGGDRREAAHLLRIGLSTLYHKLEPRR